MELVSSCADGAPNRDSVPQQKTYPSPVTPQVWETPAPMLVNVSPPATSLGSRFQFEPSACPVPLMPTLRSPQHQAAPALVRPQKWVLPVARVSTGTW